MSSTPPDIITDPIELAEQANLIYVSGVKAFGITRRKSGKGFTYLDKKGQLIKTPKTIERIKDLNIPPAWIDVWICTDPSGHIQAIGKDEKGRKQYIYHSEWNKLCQENKFNKMVFFGNSLIKIREQLSQDLNIKDLHRKKILATLVWLLENTFIRVGNEEYAQDNNSFGLTTLRNKHVDLNNGKIEFKFKGKSGVEHEVSISHPKIVKIIQKCVELPGYNLFQYIDEDGRKHVIDSEEVNLYLKEIAGEKVTAKDFRTWGGTVISAKTLNKLGDFENENGFKQKVREAVKTVSSHLRNTPMVCRAYYIHPTVIETYKEKILVPHFIETEKIKSKKPDRLTFDEFATLELLQKYQ